MKKAAAEKKKTPPPASSMRVPIAKVGLDGHDRDLFKSLKQSLGG